MARVNRLQGRICADTASHIPGKRGETYLQIDTYGAAGRQITGKVSQSIQLGKQGRSALRRLLRQFDE
ncbi:MAG: hypothetical protein LBE86_09585 [Gemmobacter sp.]|nr:hypothetical protein [Gemmobacter sp.]